MYIEVMVKCSSMNFTEKEVGSEGVRATLKMGERYLSELVKGTSVRVNDNQYIFKAPHLWECMLVILDGDGTLWNGDVLAGYLATPLRQIDENTVEDHEGKRIQLREGAREVLEELQKRRIYVALASQNRDIPVIALLRKLQLTPYFNFLELSWTEKDEMVLEILKIFKDKNKNPGKVFLVDDFEYNIEIVQANPELKFIHCINASELNSLKEILDIVGDSD